MTEATIFRIESRYPDILTADCVGFLPDWQESPGANVEYAWCKYVGKPMMGLRGKEEA